MTSVVRSKTGIQIRLTDERWDHVIEEHGELSELRAEVLETVKNPNRIVAGHAGELLAIRVITSGKFLVVVYREKDYDGFVITAFLTTHEGSLDRRKRIWP